MTFAAIEPPVDIAVGHAPSSSSPDKVIQIFPIDNGTFYVCRIVHGPLPSSGIVRPDVVVLSHCTATDAGPQIDWTTTLQPTFGTQGSAQVMGFAVQPGTGNAVIWLQMTTSSDEAWALATVDHTGLLHLDVFESSTRAVGDNGATATMIFYDATHLALFAGLNISGTPWYSLSTKRFSITTGGVITGIDSSWQSIRRFENVVTSLQPGHAILDYSIDPYHCWNQEPGVVTVFSWTIEEYAAHLDDVQIDASSPHLLGSAPAVATPTGGEHEFADRPSGSSLYCVKTTDGFGYAWENYNQFNQVQVHAGAQVIGHIARTGPGAYGTELVVTSNTTYFNNDHFQTLFMSEIFDRTAGRGTLIYDIFTDTHAFTANAYDTTAPSFTPSDTLTWTPTVGSIPFRKDVYYAVVGEQWIAVAYYLPTPGTFMLQLLKYPDASKITVRARSSAVRFRRAS